MGTQILPDWSYPCTRTRMTGAQGEEGRSNPGHDAQAGTNFPPAD